MPVLNQFAVMSEYYQSVVQMLLLVLECYTRLSVLSFAHDKGEILWKLAFDELVYINPNILCDGGPGLPSFKILHPHHHPSTSASIERVPTHKSSVEYICGFSFILVLFGKMLRSKPMLFFSELGNTRTDKSPFG